MAPIPCAIQNRITHSHERWNHSGYRYAEGAHATQTRWCAIGRSEEAFAATLTPGDTFLIGGQVVRFEGLRELVVEVSKRANKEPKIAVFGGTKFATSTQLANAFCTNLKRVIFAAYQITRPTGWNCKKSCPCCPTSVIVN